MIKFSKIRFNADDEAKYSSADFRQQAVDFVQGMSHVLLFDSYFIPSELREHYRNLRKEMFEFLSVVERVINDFPYEKDNCQ